MALPTLAKTWNHTYNQAQNYQGSLLNSGKNAVFQLFTALKNCGWTVRSSCNGTTASASDLWTTSSAVNHGTSTRSWVVLRNSALANYEICIDVLIDSNGWNNGYAGGAIAIYAAKGGYLTTSLSTSARPGVATAGDAEQTIISHYGTNAVWFGGSGQSDQNYVYNYSTTTDNTAFRFYLYNQDLFSFFLMIEGAGNPSSVWTSASTANQVIAYGGTRGTGATHVDVASTMWNPGAPVTRIGTVTTTLRASVESFYSPAGYSTWVTQGIVNDQTGEYPMLPIGLTCASTPYRMRLGNVNDMWLSEISLPHGSTFPGDGTRQFLQLGRLIVPWGTSASPGPILRTRY